MSRLRGISQDPDEQPPWLDCSLVLPPYWPSNRLAFLLVLCSLHVVPQAHLQSHSLQRVVYECHHAFHCQQRGVLGCLGIPGAFGSCACNLEYCGSEVITMMMESFPPPSGSQQDDLQGQDLLRTDASSTLIAQNYANMLRCCQRS